MTIKRSESGFSVLVIVLIILVVGLTGAVGWLVYDRQSEDKPTSEPNTANTREVSEARDVSDAVSVSYLEITEWGVKIPMTDAYSDATYKIDTGPGIAQSGAALVSIDGIGAGYFERYKIGDTVYSPAGTDMGVFNQQYYSENADFYTKVGNYYYSFVGSQSSESDRQDALRGYLFDQRKNLEAI